MFEMSLRCSSSISDWRKWAALCQPTCCYQISCRVDTTTDAFLTHEDLVSFWHFTKTCLTQIVGNMHSAQFFNERLSEESWEDTSLYIIPISYALISVRIVDYVRILSQKKKGSRYAFGNQDMKDDEIMLSCSALYTRFCLMTPLHQ